MSRKHKLRNRKRLGSRVESLESRLALTTTAFLGIAPGSAALGEVDAFDSVVRIIGEDDAAGETVTLKTIDSADGFSGHVSVTMTGLDVANFPGGRLFKAFDVSGLQADAQTNSADFRGFKVYGLAGNDTIDASGLKNFEVTELNGNATNAQRAALLLGAPANVDPGVAVVSDNDTLIGGTLSRDTYYGGRGDDLLTGVDVYDTIPNNPAIPFAFVPRIEGGSGIDTLKFNPDSPGVTFNGAISDLSLEKIFTTNNNDTVDLTGAGAPEGGRYEVSLLRGDDTFIGSNSKDVVSGGDGKDTLNGMGGEDELSGDEGDDTILGGADNDTLHGGSGNDNLKGEGGNDTLNGNDGDDRLAGGPGDDTLNGGANGAEGDWADYTAAAGSVRVSLAKGSTLLADETTVGAGDGDGGKDTLIEIENVDGSAWDDFIEGNDGANKLNGNGGWDRIKGLGGNDTIKGGLGNDTLDGEAGNDNVEGNEDHDKIFGGTGDDVLNGNDGNDSIYGEEGMDQVLGGLGADFLDGGLGFDILEGSTAVGPNETDTMRVNYDFNRRAIQDWLVSGGPAHRDHFEVQSIFFKAGLTWDAVDQALYSGPADPGGDQRLDLTRRLDAQFELTHPMGDPTNTYGPERDLVFSDFNGADGAFGDTLTFLNTQ